MENEKEDLFAIDRDLLDDEWLGQPRLVYKFRNIAADARDRMDTAEANMALVKAECELDVRSHPETHGLSEKATEAVYKAAVERHGKYQKSQAQYLNAKHAVAVAEAAVQSLEHRKKALEKLVDLFLADYFSKPREPKGDHADKFRERVHTHHVGIRRKKKRKVE